MAANVLEERLETITREFVRQIVQVLRSASFADVASLQTRSDAAKLPRARTATRVSATPKADKAEKAEKRGPRQTADRRAELGERVLKALGDSEHPLGVRALSSELGVPPDLLAAPLLELRAAGRIAKHGEKRATTYSRA